MEKKKVLVIGNKQHGLKLDKVIDSFDVVHRCNLAWMGKGNGTVFGKLAMCNHVYQNFVKTQNSKQEIIGLYSTDYTNEYLSEWYDFFQENKDRFEEIYYQNENNWSQWNSMLEEYGCPHRFSKMASTGYSTIFKSLTDGSNEVHISGFSLDKNELRASVGVLDSVTENENAGGRWHSFSDEILILNWLHKNKKINASLCML